MCVSQSLFILLSRYNLISPRDDYRIYCVLRILRKLFSIQKFLLTYYILFSHARYMNATKLSTIMLFSESLGDTAGDDAGVKELQELRDKYEGKLTASLYTGTLCIAALASLIALVVGGFYFTDYPVSISLLIILLV